MTPVDTIEFERIGAPLGLGPGRSVEYRSPQGETLAYIDYSLLRTRAAVTVFDPYRAGRREYAPRPAQAAEAIALRHLTKLGYRIPGKD